MEEVAHVELKVLAQLLGFPYVERLGEPNPPREMVVGDFDRIIGSWGRQMGTIPFDLQDDRLIIATCNPLNLQAFDQLSFCYNKKFDLLVTEEVEITRAINTVRSRLMSDRSNTLTASEEEQTESDINAQLKIDVTDAEDDDAPIIRYVNAVIFRANSERASDVHIEPYESTFSVRFRIDGVLVDRASEDKLFYAAISSRIKVMAGLNIAEKRLPQDGRIGIKIAGRDVDIRVSTIPTQYGERIVMRLLDKHAVLLDLEQLGINGQTLNTVVRLINKPHGIILVTGPTGSGKTTTLYACLSRINTPDLNILTIEDPIEYQLERIGQMQVNPKINFTFANGLRSILRQDPDVVMVGEIRDRETAEIAVQASLTGHLVLSTLHTNDSAGAVTRLIDMGVEPFLVASSLLGVMAQRLVRKLCSNCRVGYQLSSEELSELGLDPRTVQDRAAFRASDDGCERCQKSGYTGRIGIHELLMIDDQVRSLILQKVDSSSIKSAARKNGFAPLREDGGRKVLAGLTSVEEVLRVTHEEIVGQG